MKNIHLPLQGKFVFDNSSAKSVNNDSFPTKIKEECESGYDDFFPRKFKDENESFKITLDDKFFVVPITTIKEETSEKELESGLAVLEDINESTFKEPKMTGVNICLNC